MDITYSSRKLEKQLGTERAARVAFGALAERIVTRISLLAGANALCDVPSGPPIYREKLSDGRYSLRINANWRLVVSPTTGTNPDDITAVRIESIEDYH